MKNVKLLLRWICACLGWILFFFWWREASTPGWVSPRAVIYSLLTIGLVVLAAAAYAIAWILHNKRVARRGRRGYVSFYKSPHFEADALGRPLKLTSLLRNGNHSVIVVRQNGGEKEYLIAPSEQGVGS
jgi:hypothetical protein